MVGPRKAVRLRLVQVHPILMVAQHLAMTRRLLDTSRWLSSKISEILFLFVVGDTKCECPHAHGARVLHGVLVRGSGLEQLGQEGPAPSKSPCKRRSAPRSQRHARNRHRVQSSHGWHESNPIGTRLGPSQSAIRLKIPIGLAPSQSIAIGLAPSQSITIGLAPSQSNPIHPIGPQSNPIQSNRQSIFRLDTSV